MGRVAWRACSDEQLPRAALSIACIGSNEFVARAALGDLERDGLRVEGRHLGAGRAAVERLATGTDLVLILEDGPQRAGVIVSAARRRAPYTGIVAVVQATTRGGTRELLDAGADALVLDGERQEVLAAAVRSVSLGQISVPRPFRGCLMQPALSHREWQISALVAAGFTNAQIAERLCLAESTIKAHLSSLFRRLGVGSRRQAVAALLAADDELPRSILSFVRPIERQR